MIDNYGPASPIPPITSIAKIFVQSLINFVISLKLNMMDDTIKYPYCFTITPLHIEHRDKAKIKSKKKILIKLGSNNIKFDYFDVPLTINADIQYSRIMEKFYPLKGIIKVYDVT